MEGMSMITIKEKIRYLHKATYTWIMPSKIISENIPAFNLDETCKTCDSIKDKEIEKLKADNKKQKKLAEFLRNEVKSLELETALSEKAIPLKTMVEEFTSTPEGKATWDKAWIEQSGEWTELVRQGKMSQIKYYRLINGIDQKTLAEKLRTAQPNISRIEKAGYNVPTKTLKKLTEIFGVKMEDLIES
jgi:ribosome-binding protein aMBF1 (putative translation factor)